MMNFIKKLKISSGELWDVIDVLITIFVISFVLFYLPALAACEILCN